MGVMVLVGAVFLLIGYYRFIGAGRTDVCELLALQRVHFQVVAARMFADDHALIDRFTRVDEHASAILQVEQRVADRTAIDHTRVV